MKAMLADSRIPSRSITGIGALILLAGGLLFNRVLVFDSGSNAYFFLWIMGLALGAAAMPFVLASLLPYGRPRRVVLLLGQGLLWLVGGLGVLLLGGPIVLVVGGPILWNSAWVAASLVELLVVLAVVYLVGYRFFCPHKTPALWFHWVLANALGGTLYGSFTGLEFLAYIMFGTIMGLAQWMMLRRYVHQMKWWVLACTGATIVGIALGWLIVGPLSWTTINPMAGNHNSLAYNVASFTVICATIGFAQWLILRRHVRNAGWWIPVNAGAGAGFATSGTLLSALLYEPAQMVVGSVIAGSFVGLGSGAVFGVITGTIVFPLLRSTPSDS